MNAFDTWLHTRANTRAHRHHHRATTTHPPHLIDFASNDYLNLSRHPAVINAAITATHTHGTSSRSSPLVTGTLPIHEELEHALTTLTGHQSALVFSSGYTANLAALTSLSSPDTLIIIDEHIHASLRDAAQLSRSPVTTNPHNNLTTLEHTLQQRTQTRAIVVVESIYSVLGDAPNLETTAHICNNHDALLVIDDAHGLGVLGNGRGGTHAAGLTTHDNVLTTATLSKALGAMGGAILGPTTIREHLVNTARQFIYDTSLAPAPAAAATAACKIITTEPERTQTLHHNATHLAHTLNLTPLPGAILTITMPTPHTAHHTAETLRNAGYHVGCFRPPSVPDGISRLRLTVHTDTTPQHAQRLANLIEHTQTNTTQHP